MNGVAQAVVAATFMFFIGLGFGYLLATAGTKTPPKEPTYIQCMSGPHPQNRNVMVLECEVK